MKDFFFFLELAPRLELHDEPPDTEFLPIIFGGKEALKLMDVLRSHHDNTTAISTALDTHHGRQNKLAWKQIL